MSESGASKHPNGPQVKFLPFTKEQMKIHFSLFEKNQLFLSKFSP
jgi:hypothetical protein